MKEDAGPFRNFDWGDFSWEANVVKNRKCLEGTKKEVKMLLVVVITDINC